MCSFCSFLQPSRTTATSFFCLVPVIVNSAFQYIRHIIIDITNRHVRTKMWINEVVVHGVVSPYNYYSLGEWKISEAFLLSTLNWSSFFSIWCFSFSFFWECQNHCQFSYNGHCHVRQQSRYQPILRFCQNCFGQFLCQRFGQIMVFNTEIIGKPPITPSTFP